MTTEYLAIHDNSLIAKGSLETIVRKAKAAGAELEPYVFEFETCKRIDLNWHGDTQTVLDSLPRQSKPGEKKRGRPKLGVTAKEVTLLPRHWEWLASQRGGTSVTLRRLVDHAIKNASVDEIICMKQNQLYGLMSVLADEPGFEEATRALYRNSKVSFEAAIAAWPADIKEIIQDKFNAINDLHQG